MNATLTLGTLDGGFAVLSRLLGNCPANTAEATFTFVECRRKAPESAACLIETWANFVNDGKRA